MSKFFINNNIPLQKALILEEGDIWDEILPDDSPAKKSLLEKVAALIQTIAEKIHPKLAALFERKAPNTLNGALPTALMDMTEKEYAAYKSVE